MPGLQTLHFAQAFTLLSRQGKLFLHYWQSGIALGCGLTSQKLYEARNLPTWGFTFKYIRVC